MKNLQTFQEFVNESIINESANFTAKQLIVEDKLLIPIIDAISKKWSTKPEKIFVARINSEDPNETQIALKCENSFGRDNAGSDIKGLSTGNPSDLYYSADYDAEVDNKKFIIRVDWHPGLKASNSLPHNYHYFYIGKSKF